MFLKKVKYQDRLKSSWTSRALLLCRKRRWMLCQLVMLGIT